MRRTELSRPRSPHKKPPRPEWVRNMMKLIAPKLPRWAKYSYAPFRPARHIATARRKRAAEINGQVRMEVRAKERNRHDN